MTGAVQWTPKTVCPSQASATLSSDGLAIVRGEKEEVPAGDRSCHRVTLMFTLEEWI